MIADRSKRIARSDIGGKENYCIWGKIAPYIDHAKNAEKLKRETEMESIKTLKAAREIAGNITTRNSKMPGSAFAISAKACNVGSALARIEGSVCHKCYALKLQALRPTVDQGWTSNLDLAVNAIAENPDAWSKAIAFQIERAAIRTGENYHRWFDSGDLQSPAMLAAIVTVAELTPHIQHWLPTREAKIVRDYLKSNTLPDNLVIRVSATMIGDKPVRSHEHTSTVHRKGDEAIGHACPSTSAAHRALRSDGKANCGDCRACWDSDVSNISYPLH